MFKLLNMVGWAGRGEPKPKVAPVAQRDLRKVAEAARNLDRAKYAFEQAVLQARASGETFRDIGKAAGLSHGRIAQIVKQAEGR